MSNAPNENKATRILLWGPTSSGKDWLLHALARSLKEYNDNKNLQRRQFKFEFHLKDRHGIAVPHDSPPIPQATIPRQDENLFYEFRRQAAQEEDPEDRRGGVNSHVHQISMRNFAGDDLINFTQRARIQLREADGVIILLDHTLLLDGSFTLGEHLKALTALADRVENRQGEFFNPNRSFTVAFTKVDKCPTVDAEYDNVWDLIEGYFNEDMLIQLRRLNLAGDDPNQQATAVSACGWLDKEHKLPNIDPATGSIIDAGMWKPWQVEQPFFSLFETIEKSFLEQKESFINRLTPHYVPYPPPRNDNV